MLVKINKHLLTLSVINFIISVYADGNANAAVPTTMSVLNNNGSLDQYYVPNKGDTSSNSETTTLVDSGSQESSILSNIDATTSLEENMAATSTKPITTKLTATPTSLTSTPSLDTTSTTIVWWTPESLISSTSTSTTSTSTTSTSTTSTSTTLSSTTLTSTTSTTSATRTTSNISTSMNTDLCQTQWGQCGGLDYTGPTCCQSGLKCVLANSYWARCIEPTTVDSVATATVTTGNSKTANNVKTTVVGHTSIVTLYDYSTSIKSNTVITHNSQGIPITVVVESTSVTRLAKGVSSVVEFSTATNGANRNTYGGFCAFAAGIMMLL